MQLTKHLRRATATMKRTAPRPPADRKTTTAPRPRSGTRFSIRTRIARSLGKADTNNRFQIDALRVLPGPKRDRVIVQATDGHQAVCLVAPGSCDEPTLVPGDVLPTRKPVGDVEVTDDHGGWRCSDGKLVEKIAVPKSYPAIGDVLPIVSGRGAKPHVVVGLDLTSLGKIADALDTPKLTLIIPTPPSHANYVNQAVAVCPADDDAGVHGIAVVMPLTPRHQADYYTKVRRDVVAAEKRYAGGSQSGPMSANGVSHKRDEC